MKSLFWLSAFLVIAVFVWMFGRQLLGVTTGFEKDRQ